MELVLWDSFCAHGAWRVNRVVVFGFNSTYGRVLSEGDNAGVD